MAGGAVAGMGIGMQERKGYHVAYSLPMKVAQEGWAIGLPCVCTLGPVNRFSYGHFHPSELEDLGISKAMLDELVGNLNGVLKRTVAPVFPCFMPLWCIGGICFCTLPGMRTRGMTRITKAWNQKYGYEAGLHWDEDFSTNSANTMINNVAAATGAGFFETGMRLMVHEDTRKRYCEKHNIKYKVQGREVASGEAKQGAAVPVARPVAAGAAIPVAVPLPAESAPPAFVPSSGASAPARKQSYGGDSSAPPRFSADMPE